MDYQKALDQGIVKEGDYFQVKYREGQEVLFRLVKRKGERYVWWGPPTKGKIFLKGKKGYDNLFELADVKARKEYSNLEMFEGLHAVGLDEKGYTFRSHKELHNFLKCMNKMFKNPEDLGISYAVASRCVYIDSNYAYFGVFYVSRGCVYANTLYRSDGDTWSPSLAVRPEATPKSNMKILIEGCDGSKGKPWICLSSEEVRESYNVKTIVTDEILDGMSKEELASLIERVQERLTKM